MTEPKTTPWNVQDSLTTPADCAAFIDAVVQEAGDDAAFIAQALGEVARSRGMAQTARASGLTREGLYKSLSVGGNPSFATVVKVLHAMGLRLTVQPVTAKVTVDAGFSITAA